MKNPTAARTRLRLALAVAAALPAAALLWALAVPEQRAAGLDLALKALAVDGVAFGLWGAGAKGWLPPFVARRLISLIIVLVGASTLVFGALRLAPGDPVDAIL
ncbi:MAG: hypothetical protein KC613_28100, partial [Myxococcales bacterium]|nr:hypothetical protein [Myxococcales bacterium]